MGHTDFMQTRNALRKNNNKSQINALRKKGDFADGATAHRPRREMQSTNVRNSHTEIQSTHRSELDDHSQQTKSKHIPPSWREGACTQRSTRAHLRARAYAHTNTRVLMYAYMRELI